MLVNSNWKILYIDHNEKLSRNQISTLKYLPNYTRLFSTKNVFESF